MAENWNKKSGDLFLVDEVRELTLRSEKLYGVDDEGSLVEFNDINVWVKVADGLTNQAGGVLTEFGGELYSIDRGLLLEWNGVAAWAALTSTIIAGDDFKYIIEFNGNIYAGDKILYEYSGGTGEPTAVTNTIPNPISKMLVFGGELFMGDTKGILYKWNGTNDWVEVAPTFIGGGTDPTPITGLIIFEGEIYGLYQDDGHLFKWNGTDAWDKQDRQSSHSEAFSLIVFDGIIYKGNGASGGSGLWAFNPTGQKFERAVNDSTDLTDIFTLLVFKDEIVGAGT